MSPPLKQAGNTIIYGSKEDFLGFNIFHYKAILNTHPPYSESMNFIIEVKGFMDFHSNYAFSLNKKLSLMYFCYFVIIKMILTKNCNMYKPCSLTDVKS